jgi:hypothetical protein
LVAGSRGRHRWPRYSLRTLLIFITLLGLWLGLCVERARRQARAVAEIQKINCWVEYDYGSYIPTAEVNYRRQAQSWVPDWILVSTGADLFHNVVGVNYHWYHDFCDPALDTAQFVPAFKRHLAALPHLRALGVRVTLEASDKCLAAIGQASSLERLEFWNATDAGIAHLAAMPRLKEVSLYRDQDVITDETLRVLGSMPQLEKLYLPHSNLHLTDRGLANLKNLKRLKVLWLDGPFTDAGLANLEGLRNLEEIRLRDTAVSPAGVARLHRAIPSLQELTVEEPSPTATPEISSGDERPVDDQ